MRTNKKMSAFVCLLVCCATIGISNVSGCCGPVVMDPPPPPPPQIQYPQPMQPPMYPGQIGQPQFPPGMGPFGPMNHGMNGGFPDNFGPRPNRRRRRPSNNRQDPNYNDDKENGDDNNQDDNEFDPNENSETEDSEAELIAPEDETFDQEEESPADQPEPIDMILKDTSDETNDSIGLAESATSDLPKDMILKDSTDGTNDSIGLAESATSDLPIDDTKKVAKTMVTNSVNKKPTSTDLNNNNDDKPIFDLGVDPENALIDPLKNNNVDPTTIVPIKENSSDDGLNDDANGFDTLLNNNINGADDLSSLDAINNLGKNNKVLKTQDQKPLAGKIPYFDDKNNQNDENIIDNNNLAFPEPLLNKKQNDEFPQAVRTGKKGDPLPPLPFPQAVRTGKKGDPLPPLPSYGNSNYPSAAPLPIIKPYQDSYSPASIIPLTVQPISEVLPIKQYPKRSSSCDADEPEIKEPTVPYFPPAAPQPLPGVLPLPINQKPSYGAGSSSYNEAAASTAKASSSSFDDIASATSGNDAIILTKKTSTETKGGLELDDLNQSNAKTGEDLQQQDLSLVNPIETQSTSGAKIFSFRSTSGLFGICFMFLLMSL